MGDNRGIDEEKRVETNLKDLITQSRLRLESTVECLISYRVDIKMETRHYIEGFFRELELLPEELQRLRETGSDYKLRLKSFSKVENDTHEFFSIVLEGIAKAKLELNQSEMNLEESIQNTYGNCENIDSWGKEYTNMTSNGRVLIVDDDILILSIMNRALEMNGYEVIVTSKPHEVADIVKSGDIDLAMVDLIMPELDGFQVFENIREHVPELPVIFITGRDHMETKIDALKRGAEDYIVKPFKVEEVLARIDGILKRKSDHKFNISIDELTGAYTRKHFASRIKHYLKRVKGGSKISLSFLDLDKFKNINDTYGHLVGDEILKRFVDDTKSHLESASIFRFGGDEFLLVMEDSSEVEAKRLLERFRTHINEKDHKFEEIEGIINIGISIGVTEIETDDHMSKILDRADKALYRAKKNGRNQLVVYSDMVDIYEAKKQILIVDAENVASNLVKNRLKNLGYGVNLADSLSDIEASLDDTMDLVVLDFKTYRENKDSLDKMNILKKKVLLMISESEKRSLRPCDVFEIDEIMVKPISVTEVEKKVRRMMSQSVGD